MGKKINLPQCWLNELQAEFEKDYMKKLKGFLEQEAKEKKVIYPKGKDIFNAFDYTRLDDVKVVILGQDPYHGPNQAHGLAFSVPEGVRVPPSLVNIYKELKKESISGNLEDWAKQGVLLLNATLTVEAQKAGSHQNKGWEEFTDRVIEILNDKKENLVFLLWGSYAQKKGKKIDGKKHLVLKAPHPSPLSAYRGFFGCEHFSQANNFLQQKGLKTIKW